MFDERLTSNSRSWHATNSRSGNVCSISPNRTSRTNTSQGKGAAPWPYAVVIPGQFGESRSAYADLRPPPNDGHALPGGDRAGAARRHRTSCGESWGRSCLRLHDSPCYCIGRGRVPRPPTSTSSRPATPCGRSASDITARRRSSITSTRWYRPTAGPNCRSRRHSRFPEPSTSLGRRCVARNAIPTTPR